MFECAYVGETLVFVLCLCELAVYVLRLFPGVLYVVPCQCAGGRGCGQAVPCKSRVQGIGALSVVMSVFPVESR